MSSRSRAVVLALALAAAPGWAVAAAAEGPAGGKPREWRRLDRTVARAMERSGTPGLALAVVRNGRTVYAEGYGVLRAGGGDPVTPESIFEAASLGKPVFAAAVVQLALQGKLALDRPLADTLEEPFRQRLPSMMSVPVAIGEDPRLLKITPRMLLTHSSGLPNWGRGEPLALAFDPGSGFRYSGEGYVHLQALVEEATGSAFPEVVRRRIFEPLGMDDSSFTWQERFEERLAWGHDAGGRPESRRPMTTPISATSLYTTAEDYARFLASMMPGRRDGPDPGKRGGRRSARGPRARRAVVDLMQPHVRVEESIFWSMGWAQETTRKGNYFWHWGDNQHYKNFTLGSLERREAVVILTNGIHGLVACRAVVKRLFGRGHPALEFHMVNY